MQYVILDLEWNNGFSAKLQGYINEIIEIGAIKLDEEMNIIGQFSIFVRPDITHRLKNRVKELTQITNEDLKRGTSFTYAVSKFKKFTQGCVIMSWSKSDLVTLESNCQYYYGSETIPFLKYYADVQEYCQKAIAPQEKNQMALQVAAEKLNIDMDDIPLHRAVGDSLLTSRVLKAVFDPEKFREYICEVDEEFYRRLNFHTTYLCNLDNPLVDPSQMIFSCPACRKDCVLMTEWKVKSKAFIADFQCPECKKTYRGRVQFKLCYEGVKVQKKLSDMPSVKEQEAENADGDGS